jgi:hypothetical protein
MTWEGNLVGDHVAQILVGVQKKGANTKTWPSLGVING